MVAGQRRDRVGRLDPHNAVVVQRARRHDHPHRRPRLQPRQPHIESRLIDIPRAAPDQDRLMPAALQMRMRPRGVAGNPAALAIRHRNTAVERGRELQRHLRAPARKPAEEARHARARLGRANPGNRLDPSISEPRQTLAVGARIGIAKRDDDARRLARHQQVRAGRAAGRAVRTRLQRHIDGRPRRRRARLFQRHRLGMRPPARLRPPAPHDPAIAHDHAADRRIGARPPAPPRGQRKRSAHPARVIRPRRHHARSALTGPILSFCRRAS